MSTACWRRFAAIVIVCAAVFTSPGPVLGQTAPSGTTIIRGVVLDRTDGSPIADVSVRVQDAGVEVKTDDLGRFELTGVAPGRRIVYVSVVGFILVKRPVDAAPGGVLDLNGADGLPGSRRRPAALRPPRRARQPHVQLGAQAPDALHRGDERARARERPLRAARRRRPHAPGLRTVQQHDPARALSRHPDRIPEDSTRRPTAAAQRPQRSRPWPV
jgi:hypothetical protein